MNLITTTGDQEVWFQEITRTCDFQAPFSGERCVAMVFVSDDQIAGQERDIVTRKLFYSGCRYALFAGLESNAWESAIDSACIESSPDHEPLDEAFTITTSHANEAAEDVVFFGLMNTFSEHHEFKRYLILFIGTNMELKAKVVQEVRALWP